MDNIEKFKNDKNKPGDLEEKLDNLTDQLLNAFENKDDIIWENGKPDKFHECHTCKELIRSDTILAGPHHYHEQCFTCAHCNVTLGDNFYSINSENYCLQHKDVNKIYKYKISNNTRKRLIHFHL